MRITTQALSAALLHFVWQGAIVGFLLWATLAALRSRSANARYLAGCAALVVLVALPVITTAVLYSQAPQTDVRGSTAAVDTSPRTVGGVPQAGGFVRTDSDFQSTAWVAQVQQWALPLWSLGVMLFSMRLACGGAHVFMLRRRGTPADQSVLTAVADLATRMGIERPVRVLISKRVDVPSVLGWLGPVILLPPATAMGLTTQQLEAVLAHELAHVQRHDYLVNILQMLVETLLFYHPAVWWTSKQIRRERELCCDDLAVRACGDALCYARALTRLERMRVTGPSLAMSSTGGPLLYRIQRLLAASTRQYGPSRWPSVLAICLGLASVALNVAWLRAQKQSDVGPQFEVASIKPNMSTGRGLMGGGCQGTDRDGNAGRGGLAAMAGASFSVAPVPLGSCRMTRTSLKMLMQIAFGFFGANVDRMIEGGPKWLDVDRYDVLAKAENPTTEAQLKLMLQDMLADRFQLKFHHETREVPAYALIVAKNGARLEEATGAEDRQGITMSIGKPLVARNVSTSDLSRILSGRLDRPVVDKTGLTGRYNFTLTWTPGENEGGLLARLPADVRSQIVVPDAQAGPSIFTAVKEQLGLQLDSARGPVDVLVIDRAERPSGN
jgi:uncharacterized protein (TIGR03435 family)